MTSFKTPHPEFYYSHFLDYQLDHYEERIKEETDPEAKQFLQNQLDNLLNNQPCQKS